MTSNISSKRLQRAEVAMGKRGPDLTVSQKEQIASLHDAGFQNCVIAKILGVSRSTICNFIKRYNSRGSIENRPRTGRHKLFTARDATHLSRVSKVNRTQTLREITSTFNQCRDRTFSQKTIQRELHKQGIKKLTVRKTLRVTDVNRRKRVEWCRGKRYRTVDDYWNRVIFSDECKVVIGQDTRVRVWRKVGEEWLADCLCPPSKRRLSLMIWGCVSFNGVGTLTVVDGNINAQRYIETLEDHLWPVVARYFPDDSYIFQDDNAPVHRARIVHAYRQQNNIHGLVWPAQSPDLNIIENVWLKLKRELQKRSSNIDNVVDLERAIRQVWFAIDPAYIQSLYRSIPRRVLSVVKANGHITKY